MAIIQSTGFYWTIAQAIVNDALVTKANGRIKIYSTLANMPADADDWSIAGSSGDELAEFSNFDVEHATGAVGTDDPNRGKLVFGSGGLPNPSTVNASATGTAAWYAMYDVNSPTNVLLGEITLSGGNGTLHLDSLSLTSGNPTTILDWGVVFKA